MTDSNDSPPDTPASVKDFFRLARPSVTFVQRSTPLPGDLRQVWRLATLCLILERAHRGSASMEQIHVLCWAIRSADGRATLLRWFDGDRRPEEVLVRYDPSTSATIDLAVGRGLAALTKSFSVNITANGRELASRIWADEHVMTAEKDFIRRLPNRVTKTAMRQLLEWS